MKVLFYLFFCIGALFVSISNFGCSHGSQKINDLHAIEDVSLKNQYYIIWAHSDIQPRNQKERKGYERAIDDVINNIPGIDIVIFAGDIIHTTKISSEVYQWFNDTRKKANLPYWYEIAGNHDARDLALYYKYIKKPLHYTVIIGNMVLIFLSDEDGDLATKISDKAFEWWKGIVINNQDKIIITISHGSLGGSGLLGSEIPFFRITNSGRFEEVLKKYYVDIWLSGHTHVPSYWGKNESKVKTLNNTQFINVSRIRNELGMNVESRLIIIKKNSPDVVIKTRDHDKKIFIKNREINLKLRYPFIYNNKPPQMIVPDFLVK